MPPKSRLTHDDPSALKAAASPYKRFYGGGLYLIVRPNGSHYWRLKFWFEGLEKCMSLGVYPGVSLSAALQARDQARRQIRAGFNPVELRRIKQRQDRAAQLQRKIEAELRSLRVALLTNGTVELQKGGRSFVVSIDGARYLRDLLARLPI